MPCAVFPLILYHLYIAVEWVKAKLKSLRNSYTRAKKIAPSGSARKNPTKRGTWLLEKLQFLAPYIATRVPISNMDSVSSIRANIKLDTSNCLVTCCQIFSLILYGIYFCARKSVKRKVEKFMDHQHVNQIHEFMY